MSDKFRRVVPFSISFADGEMPSATKLNVYANAFKTLERPLGDPWNWAGDSVYSAHPLQIPNLSRIVGKSSHLNNPVVPLSEFYYIELLGTKNEDLTDGYLLFKPIGSSWHNTGSSAGIFTSSPESSEVDVDGTGKWWVDSATGRFKTYDPLTTNDELGYIVNPFLSWQVRDEVVPNVIPDSRQTEFTGVRVSKTGSTYYIHLPPRRPLTLSGMDTPYAYPTDSTEITDNQSNSTTELSYWQLGPTAQAPEHYRYSLPKEITNAWNTGDIEIGDIFGDGALLLWDLNNDVPVDITQIKFVRPVSDYKYYIELDIGESTFDFDSLVSTDDTQASYDDTNLALVCIGSSLSKSVQTVSSAFWRHTHDNTGTLEPVLSHNVLADQNPPPAAYTGHSTYYPAYLTTTWQASNWTNDPHTSLLSRAGTNDSGEDRDTNKNAMLGHLLMPNSAAVAGVFLDAESTDGSFGILWGDSDGMLLHATSGNHLELFGSSAGTGNADGSVNFDLRPYAADKKVSFRVLDYDGEVISELKTDGLEVIGYADITASGSEFGIRSTAPGVTSLLDLVTGVDGNSSYHMSVDFDDIDERVYFSDKDTVKRVNLDGSGLETVFTSAGDVGGIALDNINEKIYAVENGTVARMNFDGSNYENLEVLASGIFNNPSCVAVDPVGEKIYVGQISIYGSNHLIIKADLDGFNGEILLPYQDYEVIEFIRTICLDLGMQRVLFGDHNNHRISLTSMLSYTSGPAGTLVDTGSGSCGAAVDPIKGKIYYGKTDGHLYQADLHDGGNSEVFLSSHGILDDLAISPDGTKICTIDTVENKVRLFSTGRSFGLDSTGPSVAGVGTKTKGKDFGLWGIGDEGRGVVAESVATNAIDPTYAAFRIIPQYPAPTNAACGDMYVTRSGKLMIYNGSAWAAVGGQS